jgi:hypothetical protein
MTALHAVGINVGFDDASPKGREKVNGLPPIEALGDALEDIELGKAGGIDGPDLALDALVVIGAENHAGKTIEGIKAIAGPGARLADECLARQVAVVAAPSF